MVLISFSVMAIKKKHFQQLSPEQKAEKAAIEKKKAKNKVKNERRKARKAEAKKKAESKEAANADEDEPKMSRNLRMWNRSHHEEAQCFYRSASQQAREWQLQMLSRGEAADVSGENQEEDANANQSSTLPTARNPREYNDGLKDMLVVGGVVVGPAAVVLLSMTCICRLRLSGLPGTSGIRRRYSGTYQ